MTSRRKTLFPVAELARVLEVGPLGASEDRAGYTFLVEIFRRRTTPVRYAAKLWRMDSYRVRPSFPVVPGTVADEELRVVDLASPNGVEGKTLSEVEKRVLEILRSKFVAPLSGRLKGRRQRQRRK